MAKSRRTRNAKRINDGAAEDLLKIRFASVGLKGVPIPKKSIEALSKVIGTNDMAAMSKIIAASIKYAQGVEATAVAVAAGATGVAAPAAAGDVAPLDPAFASAVALSTSAKHKKRSHKHRVKIDFMNRGTPTPAPVLPGPPRFPAPPMTPYDTCRAQCAASCAAKIKETPFVRKAGSALPPPSSTQELHALFSNLSPARTPPTRRRLRKLGEVAPKPYYHQRTRVSNRGGIPAQNIPYRG